MLKATWSLERLLVAFDSSDRKRRPQKIGAGVKRQREGLLKPNVKAWRPHHDLCLPPRGMTSTTAFGPIIGPVGSITWLPATAHSGLK
jgi:hypothetical protein